MKFSPPLSALLVLVNIQLAWAKDKHRGPTEVNRVTLDGVTYINKVRNDGLCH